MLALNMDINKITDYLQNKINSKIVSVKYIGGGSYGRVYKCEDDNGRIFAVKIFLNDGMAYRESLSLQTVAKSCVLKIPEVYGLFLKSQGSPADFIYFEYIDGKDAFTASLKKPFIPKKIKNDFAEAVTDALLSIHTAKSDKFGPIESPDYDSWLDYYSSFSDKILHDAEKAAQSGKLNKNIFEIMKQAYDRFDSIFSDKVDEACLIHGDLNVMNVIVDKKFKPIAIIDPLNSIYGDREYDLFQLMNLSGNRFDLYETYKRKFKTSDKCDLKCAFYRLFNEVMCGLDTHTPKFILDSCAKYMKSQLKLL